MVAHFEGMKRWAKLGWLLPFLFLKSAGGRARHPKRWTNSQDRCYLFCWHPKPSGRMSCILTVSEQEPWLPNPKQISHGSVTCGRQCVTVFDVQAIMSFPTEAPSGDAAVTEVASSSSHAGSLLSNEISLAGELTRSLLPYLDALTKLFASNYPWNFNFVGKFCSKLLEARRRIHRCTYTCVHPHTPLQDSIIAQVLFPWKQG